MSNSKSPQVLIFMGVCGCGKSTVGHLVANALELTYAEGDDFHSEQNVEKMRSGTPLDDDDRAPWLAEMATEIASWVEQGKGGVLSCSSLKRRYRDILRGDFGVSDTVRFFHLCGTFELIEDRMSQRQNHYMPPGLLTSQFATLEVPSPDEQVIELDIAHDPEVLARQVLEKLGEA